MTRLAENKTLRQIDDSSFLIANSPILCSNIPAASHTENISPNWYHNLGLIIPVSISLNFKLFILTWITAMKNPKHRWSLQLLVGFVLLFFHFSMLCFFLVLAFSVYIRFISLILPLVFFRPSFNNKPQKLYLFLNRRWKMSRTIDI